MRRFILASFLSLIPVLAVADDTLARLEAGTVAMTNNLLDFYVSRAPELADVRPDMSWDDTFRDAGACVLEALANHGGADTVETYLVALEGFATVEIETFGDMAAKMPDVLADPKALEAQTSCGMIDISSARMDASGLTEAFQAEGVLQRVIGQDN